jgi:hypothetical protein
LEKLAKSNASCELSKANDQLAIMHLNRPLSFLLEKMVGQSEQLRVPPGSTPRASRQLKRTSLCIHTSG